MADARVPMLRGNDENVRPDFGPNDQDRERFGFTKRKSKILRQSSAGLLGRLPEERPGSDVPLSARGEGPVALVPLVDITLGDPDAKLHLLRTKPAAPRYDFKGRINELTDQNRALRSALAEEREKKKQLADVLARCEMDINFRLRASAGEAEDARRQLDTQGQLQKMVQEAVRSVWREAGSALDAPARKHPEEEPASECLAVAGLRAQLEMFRQCSAAETSRALRAELLLREREEELAQMKQDLQDLGQELSKQREVSGEHARAAAELVRDAGGLLQQQEAESTEKFKALSAMAQQREEELATQLAEANARIRNLETQLSSARA
uniref:Uncharacterized protein n=1 Tax=Alexandrium monilatum TaxID=311494 RepID=A0A7S4VVV5_9DINO